MEDRFHYHNWALGIPSYALLVSKCPSSVSGLYQWCLEGDVKSFCVCPFVWMTSLRKARKVWVPCFPSLIFRLCCFKTLKRVQRFLGFANFYRRFIHNFSTIVAPISALNKGSPTCIQWTAEALWVLWQIKEIVLFCPNFATPRSWNAFYCWNGCIWCGSISSSLWEVNQW